MNNNVQCLAKDGQGNISKGEYTGYSHITGLHYVSFYNGYVGQYMSLSQIQFIDEN